MLKIGHRGRPGFPRQGENTIRSFETALAMGADGIEFDVRGTKDGKIIIMHDADVARTTGGQGIVGNLVYEEIKRLDAGDGEHPPLLSEVLAQFAGKCLINIELKERGIAEPVREELWRLGAQNLAWPRAVIVSAFDSDDNDEDANSSWEELSIFRPVFPIALLASVKKILALGEEGFIAAAKGSGARSIHPQFIAVTPSLVSLAHKENILVCPWTVNDEADIRKAKALGVDGIISDFTERL